MALKISEILTWTEYFKKTLYNQIKPVFTESVSNVKPSYNDELNNKVSLLKTDITKLEIDAIVNAANKTLLGGSGVDGAIHKAAGPQLKEECKTLKGCETAEAKITKGYNLPAKHVIHTVGPIGENSFLLKLAYENCLKVCRENNLRTIAFPCISTGVYGYPQEKACQIALQTVRNFLESNHTSMYFTFKNMRE
ncbi:macro domain-containing protein CT2219-like isoform X2 [Daktulosphaira vitifoliae]|uniref:macro domain-containing protein CT2219-like isoform X2 n=1 Tax=Daktulosphaira vitifoliae TaxID=58002 RepID=UPI0021AAA822|nr:macro domain-containing protein CT2219-like isoform X2 [Daktulosphaira vitifoliae]